MAGATPDDVLYFPVDGSALASVKVYWPEEAVRQAQGGAIAKDQREKEAFLAADWLSAELKEVAPAQAVALTLGHERPKLTFTLAGTMSGSRITALSVAGYDAYCDPQTGDAQLIMLPGNTEIALGSHRHRHHRRPGASPELRRQDDTGPQSGGKPHDRDQFLI